MESNKNLTVFQKLTKVFGFPGTLKPDESPFYRFSKDDILKTNDKQEYDRELLQAQQSQYLADTWKKLDQSLYNQSVYYEPNRLAAYYDYESMEFTPEISAALDIYAEESTTMSEKGEILTIYSESDRVKNILKDLFTNKLDINTNLQMWTRGVCKYGDNFVYLKISPEKGIVGCQQLPNVEIERIEGSASKTPTQNVDIKVPPKELKFQWKNKDLQFQSWEVAHFRLLGDDRKLPYGTCLKYDTKIDMEYGVKEIKDVKIGDNVWSFDLKTEKKTLSKVLDVINSGKKTNYQIHTKHNFIEASEEHRILIFENEKFIYKNIKDIVVGDVLVIDNRSEHKTKKIPINKETPNENKNGWFNNIDNLPNFIDYDFARFFGFMLGDGWINKQEVSFALSEYDELNDYYINLLNKFSGKAVKINIDNNGRETYVKVNSKLLSTLMKRMGFNGTSHTKRLPEWSYYLDDTTKKALLEGFIDADGWLTQDKWTTSINIELANEMLVKDVKTLCQKLGYKTGSIRKRKPRKDIIIEGRKIKNPKMSYLLTFYDTKLEQTKKYDNINRKNDSYILEPINKIIDIGKYETYDIYVENENHNFYANGVVVHNSMIDKVRRIWKQLLLAEDAMLIYRTSRAPERRVFKIFVGNMDDKDIEPYVQKIANKFKRDVVVDARNGQIDTRYNQMAVDQDYFIPVRDPSMNMPIETLPGAQNLGEIADIQYIQKKMLAALRIPKAFLGFEEVVGEGKTLALMDIRFARTINKIQKSLIQELNKIALIHLYLLGLEDDLDNFTLSLTNPSAQSDLLRIEQWKEKISLYKDATSDQSQVGILPVSHTWGKKNILGMSESEVLLDLQQQRMERAIGFELMNTQSIIKRSGIFDEVDKKYGIPEQERQKLEASGATEEESPSGGGGFGGAGGAESGALGGEPAIPPPAGGGGEPAEPLSESFFKEKKLERLFKYNNSKELDELFDYDKAKRNIYEIENQIKKILND